jgi:UrcA family protein
MRNGKRLTILLPACLTLGAVALLADTGNAIAANAADGARSVTIRYDDLDTGTSSGVQTLYARLDEAARQVCDSGRTLVEQRQSALCYRQALRTAVGEVNNPYLTALYAEDHVGTRTAMLND